MLFCWRNAINQTSFYDPNVNQVSNDKKYTSPLVSRVTDEIHVIDVDLRAVQTQQHTYQSGHTELQAEHQVELFAFKPADCIRVLSHSQRLSTDTEHKHTSYICS